MGENMDRVKEYARRKGGHAYKPWPNKPFDKALGMRRNERWIRDQKRAGREIIDIGPDFRRRATPGKGPSDFYEMERRVLGDYPGRKPVFDRARGGVPGLDF